MNVWMLWRPGSAFWLRTQVVKHSVTVTSGGIISQLLAMLPSIQSAECVCHEGTTWSTENTVYLGLWIYSWPSAFCYDGNLGLWSLQQCESAPLINPTSLLELKQYSMDSTDIPQRHRRAVGNPHCFTSTPKRQHPPQGRGELYSFKLATVVVITLLVTRAIIC